VSTPEIALRFWTEKKINKSHLTKQFDQLTNVIDQFFLHPRYWSDF